MADQTECTSEPMLNPTVKRVRSHRERVCLFAKYAQRITACQRKSIQSIVECGRLLIAAKDELKHGEFLKMIDNNLPFKRSSAQALMKIAADRRITKYQHAGCLPAHWSTLIKVIQLPDAAFEARIADGTIHPGLERRPAVEMVESYFSSLANRRKR
jgi:Protein of unknown function (DUF3102)